MMGVVRADIGPMVLALAAGAAGAFGAQAVSLPLPWMLGPMCVCTALALLKVPIRGPMPIRPPMIAILGIMLGSGFSPEMLGRASQWAVSLAMLGAYVATVGALAYPYFRRVGGYDRVTAFFAGMPGGLNEMMLVGHAYGGDDRRIVLTHASRILLAVLLIPIFFRLTTDIDMSNRSAFGVSIDEVSLKDYAILATCAVVGVPVAKLLRLPAALLIGPMIISAFVHLMGWSASQPPREIVNLAQWIIGTVIGCRFVGVARAEIFRVLRISVGATAIMLAVCAFFALLLHWLVGMEVDTVVLAYAPGGLAEMSLVALALGTDVAFVATHHMVRIILVVMAAPAFFRLSARWNKGRDRETRRE
ncbi:AbrB family transcriptional regulator [Marivibrio halodurans]|uniref:AbrB family transcriptional regulator n=1 Tax=Marivibrio halodurans TaxID=2039722 RepID=A0A8J7SN29_9PROT|nr:AbrB family transcriptional regulator [Marivibrio halodurans]MBP5857361.1 AbrB family transcriptional regulator [Marivibrio halodurans]